MRTILLAAMLATVSAHAAPTLIKDLKLTGDANGNGYSITNAANIQALEGALAGRSNDWNSVTGKVPTATFTGFTNGLGPLAAQSSMSLALSNLTGNCLWTTTNSVVVDGPTNDYVNLVVRGSDEAFLDMRVMKTNGPASVFFRRGGVTLWDHGVQSDTHNGWGGVHSDDWELYEAVAGLGVLRARRDGSGDLWAPFADGGSSNDLLCQRAISERYVSISNASVRVGGLVVTNSTFPAMRVVRTGASLGTSAAFDLVYAISGAASDGTGSGMLQSLSITGGPPVILTGIYGLRAGSDNSGALVFYTSSAGTFAERARIGPAGGASFASAVTASLCVATAGINTNGANLWWSGTNLMVRNPAGATGTVTVVY